MRQLLLDIIGCRPQGVLLYCAMFRKLNKVLNYYYAPAPSHGPAPPPPSPRHASALRLRCFRVFNGFVHGQDEAGRLRCSRQRVDLDDRRLPHACVKVIGDVLVDDVNSEPCAACKTVTMAIYSVSRKPQLLNVLKILE